MCVGLVLTVLSSWNNNSLLHKRVIEFPFFQVNLETPLMGSQLCKVRSASVVMGYMESRYELCAYNLNWSLVYDIMIYKRTI